MAAPIDFSAALESLPPDVLLELGIFEGKRDVYAQLQQSFSDGGEGDDDLLGKAERLERQASAAEVDLAKMARNPKVSQAEINDELTRIETMRKEAQGLRFTAKHRTVVRDPINEELSTERRLIESEAQRVNWMIWDALFKRIIEQDGVRESLKQAYALSKAMFKVRYQGSLSADIEPLILKAFAEKILNLLDGAETVAAPLLATLPPPVRGEVRMSTAQLSKLRVLRQQQKRQGS